MADRFTVSAQGFAKGLARADGSYDTHELGEMGPDQLIELLQKVAPMSTPQGAANADICPASVHVEADGEMYSFEVCGGKLLSANTNSTVSVFDAVSMVSGKTSGAEVVAKGPVKGTAALAWGSDNPDVKGLTPVRKHDLPPTDRINTEAATLNTGPSMPQFTARVWKSDAARGGPVAAIVFACFGALMAAAGIAAAEMLLVGIGAGVAVLCILLVKPLGNLGHGEFRMGFDWKRNAVWAFMPKQRSASYLGNATCITGFSVGKLSYRSAYRMPRSAGMGRVRPNEIRWQLVVHKSDNSAVPLIQFFSKRDAQAVLAAAQQLLAQQG